MTKIKPTDWEYQIQGGRECQWCGANEPCGDITGCRWWFAEDDYRQHEEDEFYETLKQEIINAKLRELK